MKMNKNKWTRRREALWMLKEHSFFSSPSPVFLNLQVGNQACCNGAWNVQLDDALVAAWPFFSFPVLFLLFWSFYFLCP